MRIKVYSQDYYGIKEFLYGIGGFPVNYKKHRADILRLAVMMYSKKYFGEKPKSIIAEIDTEDGVIVDRLL